MIDYLTNDAFEKKSSAVITELVNAHIPYLQKAPPAFNNLIPKIESLKNQCYNIKQELDEQG